jgi:soluble lytic murein transglycosylase-like protein
VALVQVGERARAERQLRLGFDTLDSAQREALLPMALELDMPGLALRLAGSRVAAGEPHLDAALYPLLPWEPTGGFTIDRALVHAVARQESRFNILAKSAAGARGLMQLMPATASLVSGERSLRAGQRDRLYDPTLNLTIGQRYLARLLGSGNLRRWRQEMDFREDPLLFIESIPSPETRDFVERVLTNFWIYRARFGQPSPSLAALAAGEWPVYHPLEVKTPDGKIAGLGNGAWPDQTPRANSCLSTSPC